MSNQGPLLSRAQSAPELIIVSPGAIQDSRGPWQLYRNSILIITLHHQQIALTKMFTFTETL